MTQSPFGGSAPAPSGPLGLGSDFGATTVNGSTRGGSTPSSSTITPGSASSTTGKPGGGGATPATAAKASAKPTRPRGPRRARLQLRHISPLTVLKFSCVLAIALFFVWLIVVGVLYLVLDAANVVGRINDTVQTIYGTGTQPPIRAGIVFEIAAIIGAVNVVLFVALATIGAVIYNLCADLVGGVEITLSER